MMNQYREETSQIHAPVELIQRTKQAVQEEENRIREMEDRRIQTMDHVWQNPPVNSEQRHVKFRRGKVFQWAIPVVGAAMLFLLLRVTTVLPKNKMDSSPMFTSQNADTGGAESADMELQFADNSMEDMIAESAEAPIGAEMNAGGWTEEPTENAAASMSDEYENKNYEGDGWEEAASAEEFDESESAADGGDAFMYVTEVEELPSFYDDPDTECVVLHDITFYVTSDWYGSWAAYVCVGGEQYVIVGEGVGETADYEAFAGKAYELLAGEADGLE